MRENSLLQNKPYLIIAASGRALAASAQRAGVPVIVLDWFDDADTHEVARAVEVVGDGDGFDSSLLYRAIKHYGKNQLLRGIVPGSGFEDRLELLGYLFANYDCLGNPPEVVDTVKDPRCFFPLLDRLALTYPEIRLANTVCPSGWLLKRIGGAGGRHIRLLTHSESCPSGYYGQRLIRGRYMSVVFLANGKNVSIVGFNETWHTPELPQHAFTYGGAVSLISVPGPLLHAVTSALQRLVPAVGLKGLCGMDFILDGQGHCQILEINPRPPATFELHEHGQSLFLAHITACRTGELPTDWPTSQHACAHAVCYTRHNITIRNNGTWPSWVTDKPQPGTTLPSGRPVCTVQVEEARHPAIAKMAVMRRLAWLESNGECWA